jgi:hypothetical protein
MCGVHGTHVGFRHSKDLPVAKMVMSRCVLRDRDHRGNIYPRVAMNEAKITAGRWEVVKTVKRCLDPTKIRVYTEHDQIWGSQCWRILERDVFTSNSTQQATFA